MNNPSSLKSPVMAAGILLFTALIACGTIGERAGIPTRAPIIQVSTEPSGSTEQHESTASPPASPVAKPSPAYNFPPDYQDVERLSPSQPLEIFDRIHMRDENQGWAVGGTRADWSHILFTGDGGHSWVDVTPPAKAPSGAQRVGLAAAFLDESNAWVVFNDLFLSEHPGAPLQVWHTLDGGKTWQPSKPLELHDGGAFLVSGISFADREAGWLLVAIGSRENLAPSALFRTVDGGKTWERMAYDLEGDGHLLDTRFEKLITFADRSTGMVVPDVGDPDPYLLWSDDGGLTWERRDLPVPDWYPRFFEIFDFSPGCLTIDAELISASTAFALVECPKPEGPSLALYQTMDGGQTWDVARVPEDGYSRWGIQFHDPQAGWLFGPTIYQTSDGGGSWMKVKEVSWDSAYFDFLDPLQGWAVAVDNVDRGWMETALVRTENGGQTWQEVNPALVP
jgi:photosystem II stability/assembly factor-like uncharacterized protein